MRKVVSICAFNRRVLLLASAQPPLRFRRAAALSTNTWSLSYTSNSSSGSSRSLSSLSTLAPSSYSTTSPSLSWLLSGGNHRKNYCRLSNTAVASLAPYFSSSNHPSASSTNNNRRRAVWRFTSSSSTSTISLSGRPIRVLFASAGGTSQLFAMQLVEQLQDALPTAAAPASVTLEPLSDHPDFEKMIQQSDDTNNDNALYIFLLSTAGVGEPPGMAKKWYDSLMNTTTTSSSTCDYAIFGLGNSLAHPHHYNSCSKAVDQKLLDLQWQPFLPLTFGDDGDCIEDDFDLWQEQVIQTISASASSSSDGGRGEETGPKGEGGEEETAPPAAPVVAQEKETPPPPPSTVAAAAAAATVHTRSCPGSTSPCGTRPMSSNNNLPFLQLQAPTAEIVRPHLLDVAPSWYQEGVGECKILEQSLLNSHNPASNGLRELRLQLPSDMPYEAGDHCILYPRNNDYIVEAYLRLLFPTVNPHAIIQGHAEDDGDESSNSNKKQYPHPIGITVYETLSHCVDLGATPSPSFARLLTGLPSDQLNYKKDIVAACRTSLDLTLEYRNHDKSQLPALSLEDFLFNLPPLQPRHYSIGSSHLLHPDKVFLTYRPVKYLTNRGHLREGLCTAFMVGLADGRGSDDSKDGCSHVVGAIRNNPTFRLPADRATSIVMIAGGCGVAPIRAFLEERLELLKRNGDNAKDYFGKGMLFLGFRTPQDAVYQDLIQQALDAGAMTESHASFDSGLPVDDPSRGNVTQALGQHGAELWKHFDEGGYTYVCGGARTMGAAVEAQIHDILMQHGGMSPDAATQYMKDMIRDGRFCEDLAD